MPPSMAAAHPTHSDQSGSTSSLRLWAIALAAVLGAGLLFAALFGPAPTLGTFSEALAEPRQLVGNLAGLAARYAAWLGASVVLGMALAAAFRARRQSRATTVNLLAAAALGAVAVSQLALIAWGLTWWLIGPTLLVAVGVLIGGLWQRRCMGKAIAAVLLALLIFGPMFMAGRAYNAALADDPAVGTDSSVTAEEKRRLIDRLRTARDRGEATGRVALDLSERDVNLLADWALEVAQLPEAAADVALDADGSVDLAATMSAGRRGWVNLDTAFELQVDAADLRIDVHRMRLGDWAVPRFIVEAAAGWVADSMTRDPAMHDLLEAVERFEINRRAIRLAYAPDRVPENLVDRLTGRDDQSELQHIARLYGAELARKARRADRKTMTDPMRMLVRAAFSLAADRTAGGADPRRENHAAVYALAVYCGHTAAQELYGEILESGVHANRPAWLMRRIRLRGRHDLARHFWISAIVALVADRHVSGFVGELKEQIDSAEGGSGFSFVDLLADRAGTRFAGFATSTPARARHAQQRLADADSTDILMPDYAGLPEGLGEAEFKNEYGGVDAARYRDMVERIDQRIDRLDLYRSR